jgi:hypothetical protein
MNSSLKIAAVLLIVAVVAVPRGGASYPVVIVGNPADKVNWVTQLARAQAQIQALQQQVQIMGNPAAAAGLVTNITAAEAQIKGSVSFGAGTLLVSASSGSAPVMTLDLAGVNVSRVLSQSGVGVEFTTGGVRVQRDEARYATLAAKQIVLSKAEADLAASRVSRAEIQSKLVTARQRLASSNTESQQRVILADIQSLQATHDMLLANEQSLVQGRDTALALIDNEAELRALAASEQSIAKANQREQALAEMQARARQTAIENHLQAKEAPVESTDWTQAIRPAWAADSGSSR